ncbi:YhgE/Pip domain-containing protein [Denitrobacterium detoxificans]|uniref:YhgE/Pip domain-containing protein n=1 Tax=Denitrobacterium detoxificans TaxID=79604 RepID=UPI0026EB6D59|nr:YhgE/Pip domain-containing protein [Denitrobacterium detoxificans]MBE6465420.1 YhgE/Pip domain-containing protein [Denitrobacterium detoxificans]
MKNVWRLFVGDLKRVFSNVVTVIIVLGLVFLPSIFSWYNILACWDVFGNTGNLKVAIANSDEGYESDLVPLEINIGDRVVSTLRANDQLEWQFVSEDEAIEGVESGEYYAAIVIPSSFSRDMMTFYSEDSSHAEIVYYTNEKKNAIAPKVTGQGADQVAYQVNEAFTQTLSDTALSIASALYEYAQDSDANGRIGELADHIQTMGDTMSRTSSLLSSYAGLVDSAESLVSSSSQLLDDAQNAVSDVESDAQGADAAFDSLSSALSTSTSALEVALSNTAQGYDDLSSSLDVVFGDANTLVSDRVSQLRSEASDERAHISSLENLKASLETLEGQVDEQYKPYIQAAIASVDNTIAADTALADTLDAAADEIESGTGDAQDKYAQAKELVDQAKASISELQTNYSTEVKPVLDDLASNVSSLADSLAVNAATLSSAADDLQGDAGSISEKLSSVRDDLNFAAQDMTASADRLTQLSSELKEALASGDTGKLATLLSTDPSTLAEALSAPVQLDRHAIFPAENFGSQMAPLYTTLAVWIGSLLLTVAIRVLVSKDAQRELVDPKPRQLFLGRFGIFALASLAQTTVMALGNMFFLGVQVNEPLLYLLCFWFGGLVFTFLLYSFVVSFANLGKAMGVLLLIVQVTAGNGSYPLQVLPDAFQAISPYLPATHMIAAMRAAMMGVYQNDFWVQLGQLALFLVPAALLGLVLRKPLASFLSWYVRKTEDSGLVQ